MSRESDHWECKEHPDSPSGFPFAVISGEEIIAWARRQEDGEFIARARGVVPRLVTELSLLLSGLENISNFVHTLDTDLHELDTEMKNRL